MLFWSFCLLTFVQSVAGLIISTLCSEFISNDGADKSLRLGFGRVMALLPSSCRRRGDRPDLGIVG